MAYETLSYTCFLILVRSSDLTKEHFVNFTLSFILNNLIYALLAFTQTLNNLSSTALSSLFRAHAKQELTLVTLLSLIPNLENFELYARAKMESIYISNESHFV